jgi:tetratricopeptide (TPR) repeat protein
LARLPKSTVLQIANAGTMERNGDFEAAIKAYEGALETDPLSLVAVNNLASLLAEYRTDTASLERAYVLSKRLEDLNVPLFQDTVGWVRYRRGEYEAAEQFVDKAVKAFPGLPIIQYHLGKVQQALGKNALATRSLKKALELAGQSEFPQRGLVQSALEALASGTNKPGEAAPQNPPSSPATSSGSG